MSNLPYDVSSTDEDSIISMWLNAIEDATNLRQRFRNWRSDNCVQWLTRNNGTQAIAVYRQIDDIVSRANGNYINSGIVLDTVYTVVLKQHKQTVKNDKNVTVMNSRVLATVGQESDTFYLLSNARMTIRKRTSGGESMETLERAVAVISKAIKLASTHGDYDDSHMFKVDEMASVATARENVSRKVIGFAQAESAAD